MTNTVPDADMPIKRSKDRIMTLSVLHGMFSPAALQQLSVALHLLVLHKVLRHQLQVTLQVGVSS